MFTADDVEPNVLLLNYSIEAHSHCLLVQFVR